MTIALGILAGDGLVIAADTQESFGDLKVSARKIFTRRDPEEGCAISVTGAGDSGYIDALSQRFAVGFEEAADPFDARNGMTGSLLSFYRDHIFPMNNVPLSQRPAVELIAGMTWKGEPPVLLNTEGSTLHEAKDFVAVGKGGEFARMLLERVVSRKHDLPLSLVGVLAAYVIFSVKESTQDCGKGTHVTMLKDGHGEYFSEQAIATMENAFRMYSQFEGAAVNYLVGRPLKNEAAERKNLAHRLETLRQQFLDMPRSDIEPSWDLNWADSPRTPPTGRWIEPILGRAVIKRSVKRRPRD